MSMITERILIPFADIESAIADGGVGFCLACGEEASPVEPDARQARCEVCDSEEVYGAEEVLLMGRVDTDDEPDGN